VALGGDVGSLYTSVKNLNVVFLMLHFAVEGSAPK
jgi:hypothetical protein